MVDFNEGHTHGQGMECALCSGAHDLKSMEAWEEDCIRKNGFYVHYVYARYVGDIPESPYVNYHTHGFQRSWSHRDFQIVFPLPPQVAHGIFWTLADHVKAGRKYEEGLYNEVLNGFPVRMMPTRETGRDVLRVILPDKNGLFPDEHGVAEIFAGQSGADVEYPKEG